MGLDCVSKSDTSRGGYAAALVESAMTKAIPHFDTHSTYLDQTRISKVHPQVRKTCTLEDAQEGASKLKEALQAWEDQDAVERNRKGNKHKSQKLIDLCSKAASMERLLTRHAADEKKKKEKQE